ncbi:glutathione synthase [Cantharellus anzutake]|uniref:glutathione synthase n=1 Tax=Cantharellus anzutake TaxID=1750568 RepID=UPI0019076B06|nr:glutathione synthase [Cantharellus anzutake]KAF8333565.1 glutathione synthase [Cantharellus anzutake]
MTPIIPAWPPSLSKQQLDVLTLEANAFALSHGLSYLPEGFEDPPTSAIHAPFTLLPTPFPRVLFQQAQGLQPLYNVLYSKVAMNTALIDEVMGAEVGAGAADDFTGTLWKGWKGLRDQVTPWPQQTMQLGLFRSDYMLDTASDGSTELKLSLKQVEFNTIAASFGALSDQTSKLHKHLLNVSNFFGVSPSLVAENMPLNGSLTRLAAGLAAAHKQYGSMDACILMVVQHRERNIFDQRLLQYELLGNHGIVVLRLTFDELISSATVDPATGVLSVNHALGSAREVAVIYYRAGYSPADYSSFEHFQVRFKLEASRSIKCPSIPLQLAGGKKMQEYLTRPGILESVLHNHPHSTLEQLRENWVQMWSLDAEGAVSRVFEQHRNLVLKPQREGGELPQKELPAWIAMQLICPPNNIFNYMVKTGKPQNVCTNVVTELGIFGWSLFGQHGGGENIIEEAAGWLARTKGKESDEGGIAVGFSVLDSIVLV